MQERLNKNSSEDRNLATDLLIYFMKVSSSCKQIDVHLNMLIDSSGTWFCITHKIKSRANKWM